LHAVRELYFEGKVILFSAIRRPGSAIVFVYVRYYVRTHQLLVAEYYTLSL